MLESIRECCINVSDGYLAAVAPVANVIVLARASGILRKLVPGAMVTLVSIGTRETRPVRILKVDAYESINAIPQDVIQELGGGGDRHEICSRLFGLTESNTAKGVLCFTTRARK
jgi:hypothetical protein